MDVRSMAKVSAGDVRIAACPYATHLCWDSTPVEHAHRGGPRSCLQSVFATLPALDMKGRTVWPLQSS
jgi:hypothetical protein